MKEMSLKAKYTLLALIGCSQSTASPTPASVSEFPKFATVVPILAEDIESGSTGLNVKPVYSMVTGKSSAAGANTANAGIIRAFRNDYTVFATQNI